MASMASAPSSAVHQQEPRGQLQPGTEHLRNQLAAAVSRIGWSYGIFWSVSTSRSGVLTWNDGFYNGEIKTRKIAKLTDLTVNQQHVLQRSEQLRELYISLLSGHCDHRARRPITALSPEDLGNTEWFYVICMTYAFRPGQGLPGKSFASNEFVWLCNAQSADSKTFPRALLAKSAPIQTIVCIPFMSGVLELGTTDSVPEDPSLVDRIAASFWVSELQSPCSEHQEPSSSTWPDETGVADDDVAFEGLLDDATEAMAPKEDRHALGGGGDDVVGGIVVSNDDGANDELERITAMEIDELIYSLCEEELDVDAVRPVEDNYSSGGGSWPVDPAGSSSFDQLVPACSLEPAAAAAAAAASSCFAAWKRRPEDQLDYKEQDAPVAGGESQKLLKKAVDGGAWISRGGAAIARESSIKNHVMSERRRREKINEMFVVLKSLLPSIHKEDKASVLAETIAYLKQLEKRVQELESSSKPPSRREVAAGKKVSGAQRKPSSEFGGGGGSDNGGDAVSNAGLPQEVPSSNVNVIAMDKEVLIEVQCRWKELLMTRVFDAIKGLRLDVLSVQASSPDGLLGLKIKAKFSGSGAVVPEAINKALREAIACS